MDLNWHALPLQSRHLASLFWTLETSLYIGPLISYSPIVYSRLFTASMDAPALSTNKSNDGNDSEFCSVLKWSTELGEVVQTILNFWLHLFDDIIAEVVLTAR